MKKYQLTIFREMQIKPSVRYNYTITRLSKIIKSDDKVSNQDGLG